MLPEATARRTKRWSRRDMLKTGAVVGAVGAMSIPAIVKRVDTPLLPLTQ